MTQTDEQRAREFGNAPQSFEGVVQTSREIQNELNEAVMKVSTILARQAIFQRSLSVQQAAEYIALSNARLQQCGSEVLAMIDPQTGRVQHYAPQSLQAEVQAWRTVALAQGEQLAQVAAGRPGFSSISQPQR